MYNGTGKFTRAYGVPSKSGISGALLSVVPGVGAVATFSPPLTEEGNCVKGIAIIEKLNKVYTNFNLFFKDTMKKDLLRRAHQNIVWTTITAINSAAAGDLETINRLHIRGLNLNEGDYDMRTPLHLAVSASRHEVIEYLIEHGADINCKDRWGATPLNDATDPDIINFIIENGGVKGEEQKHHMLP